MYQSKVFIVLINDRHVDMEVKPFHDPAKAIAYAKAQAKKYGVHEDDYQEEDYEGSIFYARFSCEGDHTEVIETEMQDQPLEQEPAPQ